MINIWRKANDNLQLQFSINCKSCEVVYNMTEEKMEMKSEEVPPSAQQEQVQMPPVLEEKKKKRVMVAIDESDESSYALKWALDNLFFYGSSTSDVVDEHQKDEEAGVVVVVHVQEPFQHYIFSGGHAAYAPTPVIDSVKQSQTKNSADVVSKAMQLCKGRPIKAETIVCDGDPKDMICQIAEQTHPDIVVVGSRGLGQLKRAFLGSVSDYCAHHLKCPVLIVKPVKPPK